jgi:hypothetical protein
MSITNKRSNLLETKPKIEVFQLVEITYKSTANNIHEITRFLRTDGLTVIT